MGIHDTWCFLYVPFGIYLLDVAWFDFSGIKTEIYIAFSLLNARIL